MDLQSEQPAHRPSGDIVVKKERGDVSVQDVDQHVAARDDVELVPVVLLDERLERVAALERAELTAWTEGGAPGAGVGGGWPRCPAGGWFAPT